MTKTAYTRLRQVCLATLDIRKDEAALSRIFGLKPCHESWLEEFGLENSLFALGGSFLELVAPIREKTAVHRFLDRNGGIGGYMAIFDCDNTDRKKDIASELGIPPVYEREGNGADLLQLNPHETGITLLEFDHHKGGTDRFDAYEWAGPNWQDRVDQTIVKDITDYVFSCRDPKNRATLWSALTEHPAQHEQACSSITLDYGNLDFVPASAEAAKDHFSAIKVKAAQPDLILKRAAEEGCKMLGSGFHIAGMDILIH